MTKGTAVLKRIDNLDILCDDVDTMARFYNETLGLPFALPFEPGAGWAMMDAGNLRIYLAQATPGQHAPKRTAVNEENPGGFDSIAFEVDDLDEAINALSAKNVEWVVNDIIRWDHNNGTWYRYRPFYDPEGNMVYVAEPHLATSAQSPDSSPSRDA
jgi:catechol 2,3-dioxygenase-like lactoylglutathione lyase family enzyme